MFALVAIGNRAWGSDVVPHWVGAVLMAVGLTLFQPLWTFPIYLGLILYFRCPSTRPWNDLVEGGSFLKGIERSTRILPLALFNCYLNGDLWSLLLGMMSFLLIPTIFYLSGKQKRVKDPVALAEFLTGALVGLI